MYTVAPKRVTVIREEEWNIYAVCADLDQTILYDNNMHAPIANTATTF